MREELLFDASLVGENPVCLHCGKPPDIVQVPQFRVAWCPCWETKGIALGHDVKLELSTPSYTARIKVVE
jgi:hypothetical protein